MLITCWKVLTPKAKYIMPNVPHTQIALVHFFGGECKNIYILSQISFFFGKKNERKEKLSKVFTIAYNTKECLRFFNFHSLNIAKFG